LFFNLIEIIPVEDTFFVVAEKPPDVWLSKEAIELNYKHLSPFKEGDMISYQTKEKVFIWFVRYPLVSEKKLFIPEGYLIFKRLKDYREAIGVYRKDELTAVSVVKDGSLLSQMVFRHEYLHEKMELLEKEYSLISPEIIEIAPSMLKISLKDILNFANFSFEKEKILESFIEYLTVPLVFTFFFVTAFNVGLKKYLENLKVEKQMELQNLKKKNKDVRELVYELQEKSSFWKKFLKNEIKYPDFHFILGGFLKAVKKNKGYVNYFEMNGNQISAWIGVRTGDTTVVNDLLQTGIFKSVKIVSSVKDRKKEGYDILNLEILVKGTEK